MGNKSTRKRLKKGLAMLVCGAMVIGGMPWDTGIFLKQKAKASNDVASNATTSAVTTDKQIKNIIYMIPDGGGYPAYDLTKAVKEAGGLTYKYSDSNFTGTKPTANKMYLADYLVGSIKTKSNNNDVTDSAAAGTALATGKKTNNGYVGVDPNYKPVASLLELAQLEGKGTGLVSTSYQYDATPASFAMHTTSRSDNEQLVKQMGHADLNVVLGGGINYNVKNATDMLKEQGYMLVGTESELENAAKNATAGSKIWSTFQAGSHHMPYDHGYGRSYDGIDDTGKKTPTLAEMTKHSIDILEEDADGFFLMVEGSKVDYGCHHGMASEFVADYIAFDEAFQVAVEYAKGRTDTAVIAVPDHNTGIVSLPTGDKLKNAIKSVQNGGDPTDGFTFTSDNKEYPHSGANVGVWMYLPEGVSGLEGMSSKTITSEKDREKYVVDNTAIPKYIASLMSAMTLDDATSQLYIDVTDKGSYNNGIFTFKEKNASVTINTDEATIDGNKVDMDGEIALWIDNKCYVSKSILEKIGVVKEVLTKEEFQGTGTKKDPYLIKDEATFLAFTNKVKAGENYKGKYFKQTAHINMAQVEEYTGLSGNETFAGIYNGQGYTIHAEIQASDKKGIAVFPYTLGMILNLGTTGSIVNTDSSGGVAGIARSIRDGGCVVNCWSTMDLTSEEDAGAIALSARGSGVVSNCYYKGKIVTTHNYGIGMTSDNKKAENCYYALEEGSTKVGSSDNNSPLGSAFSEYNAATLNGYQEKAISSIDKISSTDELCKFVDIEGQAFAFEGSMARLSSMSYTYTALDGTNKTISIENFIGEKTGYDVKAPNDLDISKGITLSGIALETKGNEVVKDTIMYVDEKGFATGEVRVSTCVKNAHYETSDTKAYSINLAASSTVQATSTPQASVTPDVKVTPSMEATPTVQETPIVVETPIVTATPNILPTHTPEMEKKELANCTFTGIKKSYIYKRKQIKPTVQVQDGTYMLVENLDYSVSYEKNKNCGTAKVTIRGLGNYSGEKIISFKIKRKSIKSLRFSKIKKQVYTGKAIKPSVVVKYGTYKLKKGKDYRLVYKNNKKKGKATIIIYGKGNYTGKKKIRFVIK